MSALHMACGGMFLADERLKSHDCTPVSPEIAKRLIDVRVPACDFPLACLFSSASLLPLLPACPPSLPASELT
jgi:hypothetical protein